MGISLTHLLILLLIVLILFGGSRLGDLGKSMGQAIRNFKKGLNEDEIDVTGAAPRREQLKADDGTGVDGATQTKKQTDKV
jgi:sec-independent protein translocase protein TatA